MTSPESLPTDRDGVEALVRRRGPLPPHEAALLVASLADRGQDVHALGASLYLALTGRPAPGGPVTDLTPSTPPELAAICLVCLEQKPSRRYASPAELSAALWAYLSRPAPPPPPPPVRWVMPAGVGVLALCLLLAGVWAVSGPRSPEKRADVGPPRTDGPEREKPEGEGPGPVDVKAGGVERGQMGGELSVFVTEKAGGAARNVLDRRARPPAAGDLIHLEIELLTPAYAYVLWIDGKGAADAIYPWDRQDPDALRKPAPARRAPKHFRLPSEAGDHFPLAGEGGIETVILLARERPLPADVRLADLLGTVSASPREAGAVPRYFSVSGSKHLFPGADIRLDPASVVPGSALDRARQLTGLFPVVQVVRFPFSGERTRR